MKYYVMKTLLKFEKKVYNVHVVVRSKRDGDVCQDCTRRFVENVFYISSSLGNSVIYFFQLYTYFDNINSCNNYWSLSYLGTILIELIVSPLSTSTF